MKAPAMSDRLRLARFRAQASVVRLRRQATRPWNYVTNLMARAPSKLLIAPQDIRTADPTVAEDIYSGYFAFGAKIVNTHGNSPFTAESPSIEWSEALMGFGWLRDLRASGTPLAKANARALVDEWIRHCGRSMRGVAWQPDVAARRLLSWLSHSPLVLEDADLAFYRRFMRNIGRHVAFLRHEIGSGLTGRPRLLAAIALAEASLCAEGLPGLQRKASRLLGIELRRQILLDGGHIGRNPFTIVDLLLDMLPLRQAYVARGVAAPSELMQAIDQISPMIRLFRHSDGALALFNGMGVTQQGALATALAYDDARARPLLNALASGYQRIEAGEAVLICDTGTPPPPEFSHEAHAGALSFEFSAAGERIIVNCGAPPQQHGALREAARLTAAHSTLTIADTSSCQFAGQDGADRLIAGRILAGPRRVPVDRVEDETGTAITASHDGYAAAFGFIHERTLFLTADGTRLIGKDRLMPAGRETPAGEGEPVAIRFHLHPQVRWGSVDEGRGAMLVTAAGQNWYFHAGGMAVDIEEGAFFGGPHGMQASMQLVIHASARAGDIAQWELELRQPG